MRVSVKKLPFLALLMSCALLANERRYEEAAFPCFAHELRFPANECLYEEAAFPCFDHELGSLADDKHSSLFVPGISNKEISFMRLPPKQTLYWMQQYPAALRMHAE
jgi:hypothetical protein